MITATDSRHLYMSFEGEPLGEETFKLLNSLDLGGKAAVGRIGSWELCASHLKNSTLFIEGNPTKEDLFPGRFIKRLSPFSACGSTMVTTGNRVRELQARKIEIPRNRTWVLQAQNVIILKKMDPKSAEDMFRNIGFRAAILGAINVRDPRLPALGAITPEEAKRKRAAILTARKLDRVRNSEQYRSIGMTG